MVVAPIKNSNLVRNDSQTGRSDSEKALPSIGDVHNVQQGPDRENGLSEGLVR